MKTATLAAWLFSLATKMPHSEAPGETPEQYEERLSTITTSIAAAAVPYADGRGWTATELSVALLEAWGAESLFDQRIHAGLPHPKWNEDHGLAKCGSQVHASLLVPPSVWATLSGLDEDATLRCAQAAAVVWVAQAKQCGVWLGRRASKDAVAKVFAAYHFGGRCKPDDQAWDRASKWEAMIAKRPDRSPVKGFRRAAPGEVPLAVREAAARVRDDIGRSAVVGKVYDAEAGGQKYALVVERHAEGRVGVSVLLKE